MIGIYQIINKANGRKYIGSAANLSKRWISHKYSLNNRKHHSKHLQSAWNKYGGEKSFSFDILEEVLDKSKLIEREQYYLDNLQPEYNIRKIAGGGSESGELNPRFGKPGYWYGKKQSEEANIKRSISLSGEKHPMYGKHHSEETKEKISLSRKKHSGPNKGKTFSKEWKQKLSDNHYDCSGQNNPNSRKNRELRRSRKEIQNAS